MIPRIFENKAVIIVGGGPSLIDFDWHELEGLPTIAINRALEVMPDATLLWWYDARFWRHHKDKILAHSARWKATVHLGYSAADLLPDTIYQYRMTGVDGFDPNPNCVRSGNNSAFGAMHLATHLGAWKIILLGVDMRHGPKGQTHFHSGYVTQNLEQTLTNYMVPYFKTLAQPLRDRRVDVLNASPISAIECWPKCSIAEGIAAARQFNSDHL